MQKKIEKQRNAIEKLARILVKSEFHAATLSSRTEIVHKCESVSFPSVIIETTLAGVMDEHFYGTEHMARKEWNTINHLIKKAELPVYKNHLHQDGVIKLMSVETAIVNELIGAIKTEIEQLDEKAAKKRK